jgi:hypothetical protein
LQACEKLTKAALEQRGIKYEKGSKGHDLRLLSGLAAGFLRIPESDIVAAQCSNKVRYGEEHSTLEQAHAAHSAMLRVCLRAVGALWPEADERTRRLAPRPEAMF